MVGFLNQVYQITSSEHPVLNMTRSMVGIKDVYDKNIVIPPGGSEIIPMEDTFKPLMFAIESSSKVNVVLSSGGDTIPIYSFSVLNAPTNAPLRWLQFFNPSESSVEVRCIVAGSR